MSSTRMRDGWLLVERKPAKPRFRVLLLPGLQGSDLVYSKLMDVSTLEENGVHLIAGNPPGFKGLDVPAGFDFKVESYAALVEKIGDAEKIDLIVGHSFAGNVLIEVAARGRYRGRLMMISPSLDRDAESKDLKNLDAMSRNTILRGPMWWLTYMMMKSAFKPYFDDKNLLAAVTADGKKIPRSVGRNILMGYFDHIDTHGNLVDLLKRTTIPVWYVRGDRDDIGFKKEYRSALEASAKIRIREIAGARHFAMADKPDELAQCIIEMLRAASV